MAVISLDFDGGVALITFFRSSSIISIGVWCRAVGGGIAVAARQTFSGGIMELPFLSYQERRGVVSAYRRGLP